MALSKTLSDSIGLIYDCVAEEALWPQALAAVTRQIGGFLTALAVFDTETMTTRLAQLACDDADAVEALGRHAGDIPFYHLLHRMELGEPMLLDQMFRLYGPDGESVWQRTGLYRHWHSRFGVRDSINMAVLRRPNRVATINVSMQTDVDRPRLDMLGLFGPHIRRAVTIHDMLNAERRESRIFRTVLDRIEHAVMIVSGDLDLLYANPGAEDLLRAEALVRIAAGRLTARLPGAQRAIARAVAIGAVDEVSLGGDGIDIPLGLTSRPAVAHILPLVRRTIGGSAETRAAAAIFIAAAGTLTQTPLEAIAALFSLTFAEKRVAGYVTEGMTRFEIAQAQGVSEATVKTQLSAIFDKTGTGDQRSLQSLMKELRPPVRRG